jgi:hypothetical protein
MFGELVEKLENSSCLCSTNYKLHFPEEIGEGTNLYTLLTYESRILNLSVHTIGRLFLPEHHMTHAT